MGENVTLGKNEAMTLPISDGEEDFILAPYFLLRIAGLPFTALEQLQCPRTVALIEEILSLEAALDAGRERLLVVLDDFAQHISDRSLQHRCLDLRRAMVRSHGQKMQRLLQETADLFPEPLATALHDWCTQAIRRSELLAAGEPTLQEELITCRQKLRALLRNDDFQRGLLLSSPTLYTELQHYLQTPAHVSNNRSRRAEEGLLAYLIRMMTKPSPYSSFTSTIVGRWLPRHEKAARLTLQNHRQKSVIRFHAGILSSMLNALARRREIRPHLRPALNPTIRRIGEGASFESIEYYMYRRSGSPRSPAYSEHLVRLHLNPLKRAILETIAQGNETLTCQQITRIVCMGEGLSTESAVAEALDALAQRAAITVTLRLPAHEDDKLACVIAELATIPGAWATHIRVMFESLQALLITYADASAEQRCDLLAAIRQNTLDICHEIADDSTWDTPAEIEKTFPNLILEDTTLAPQEVTLGQVDWQPLLADLCVLQSLAPLLEGNKAWQLIGDYLSRQALATAQPVDIMSYHLGLSRAYAHLPLQQEWCLLCPELAQLRDAQRAFTAMVVERLEQVRAQQASILVLNPDEIRLFVRHLPPFLRQRYPLAYFGQLFSQEGRGQMVLNDAWPGPAVACSRFSYLLADQPSYDTFSFTDRIRTYITELGERQHVIYASISETGGFNANIHGPLAPYEIVFPGSISTRKSEEQLSLRDLYVVCDPQMRRPRLFSRSHGSQIAPLHLGFSVADILPPLYQTLVASTSHHPIFNLIALIEARLPEEQKQQSRHYPRIALGNAILSRETWKIPRASLPRREAGESSFDYFLKMNRWRVRSGLPLEGFRRTLSRAEHQMLMQHAYLTRLLERTEERNEHASAASTTARDEQNAISGSCTISSLRARFTALQNSTIRKPFYVNFHNYFLLMLFDSAIQQLPDDHSLTFEEMLPARHQALLHCGSDDYSTEFVVESGS